MTQMTHLSRAVDNTEYEAKYDAAAKKLVSDTQVLARIVKGTVKEFEDYSIDEIIAGIEGEPEVAVREVFPGKHSDRGSEMNVLGAIHGMNMESIEKLLCGVSFWFQRGVLLCKDVIGTIGQGILCRKL